MQGYIHIYKFKGKLFVVFPKQIKVFGVTVEPMGDLLFELKWITI